MKLISSILIAVLMAVALILYVHDRRSIQRERGFSPITFQEIDSRVRSHPSDVEVNEYSRQLKGTRVRWNGTVIGVENGRTVFIATNVFPADIQCEVSAVVASSLRNGEKIWFAGTIEKVSDAETFPPMFHTYIVLKDVKVERGTSNS